MNKRTSAVDLVDPDLIDLLGPEPVKAPEERRHPFKEYTYDELTNAPKKVYLCGDDDRPVLLTDSLWQTMGLLKSGKTFFCMELGFCIAFGLEFHGLPTKEGNVAYIIAEGGIGRNFQRVLQPFGMIATTRRHLGGSAKVKPPAGSFFRMGFAQKRERADALHNVIFLPVGLRRKMDRRTGDCGQPIHQAAGGRQLIECARKKFCQLRCIADGN